jgi:hypothetical protein
LVTVSSRSRFRGLLSFLEDQGPARSLRAAVNRHACSRHTLCS